LAANDLRVAGALRGFSRHGVAADASTGLAPVQ